MVDEYKFPDEKGEDGPKKADTEKDKVEIVIEDDTPPEDRGRKPLPKEVVDELENDDLSEYSEKVKSRMAALRKAFHDERRNKEAAVREREEAIRVAQTSHAEVTQLKQRLTQGEKVFITEVGNANKAALEQARSKLKAAYEAGDAEKIAEAQEALTDAKLKAREIEGYRPTVQEGEDGVQKNQQAQAPANKTPPPDPKAEAWRAKNTWFGADPEMTATALGLHEKLIKTGVNPSSKEYYEQIDTTMRKRYPENFEDTSEPAPRNKTTTVVAPASRSTAPRQIRITASAAAMAKRLGVTPEAYAREMMKLENNNG